MLLTLEETGALIESCGSDIYSYLKALCRDPDQAADLSQNVLTRFIEKVRSAAIKKATARAYLFQMAKNEFLQTVRKKEVLPLLVDLPSDSQKLTVATNSREIHIILMETIEDPGTPPDVSNVLRMRFIENIGVNEIGEKLGKSRATVYRLMETGSEVLLGAFQKYGFDISDLG